MSAAKCLCMSPDVGSPYSLSMASRQFTTPPCPCNKCKERAREAFNVCPNQTQVSCKCGGKISGAGMGKPMVQQISSRNSCQCAIAQRQGMPSDMRPGTGQGRGQGNQQMSSGNKSPCQCIAGTGSMGSGSPLRSNKPGVPEIAFGGMTYGRKSSFNDWGGPQNYMAQQFRSGCVSSLEYGDYVEDAWVAQGIAAMGYSPGRDTFGLPIHLQGNLGLLNSGSGGSCGGNVYCDRNCGVNTGCNRGCQNTHGKIPGAGAGAGASVGAGAANSRSKGIRVCSNEYVNMILTFLMEVLGILVFFAICTITFWITVGYYIVQLLLDLKNAQRTVHVAVGIVFTLLILAFAITLVTKADGSCYQRARALRKGIAGVTGPTSSSCKKCSKAVLSKGKSSSKVKAKTQPKLKSISLASVTKTPTCKKGCKKTKKDSIISSLTTRTPQRKQQAKRQYTDCQGRSIFEKSRRNAILIEMKQPPTWIIWLRDSANSFFSRR